jgi:hypothetical protein
MNARLLTTVLLSVILEAVPRASGDEPTPESIRSAVGRALPPIEASTKEYLHHRDCFSCHHQAVPLRALTLARTRGFAIDAANLREQIDLTATFLKGASESYRKGKGQGGGVTTAGYALWTLEMGGWDPDETTAAVVEFLLLNNKEGDRWKSVSRRPPSEGSEFTSTFVALRGIRAFATAEQRERGADRTAKAKGWLEKSEGKDTEDQVFRLHALALAGSAPETTRAAADRLRTSQRGDGGWSQRDADESDAYATGSALVALHEAGGLSAEDPAYRRGLAFLIGSQRPDGTWYVKSRSRPFQKPFESGFPHGKDQFISISASGWSTAALLLALPESDLKPTPERGPAEP